MKCFTLVKNMLQSRRSRHCKPLFLFILLLAWGFYPCEYGNSQKIGTLSFSIAGQRFSQFVFKQNSFLKLYKWKKITGHINFTCQKRLL